MKQPEYRYCQNCRYVAEKRGKDNGEDSFTDNTDGTDRRFRKILVELV